MKKTFFLFILLLSTLKIYAHDSIYIPNINEVFYKRIDGINEDIYLSFLGKNKNIYIAGYVIYNDGNTFINFGGSGYYLSLSNVEYLSDCINIEFIRIWIGAEETTIGDERQFSKYKVTIPFSLIKATKSWLVEIDNVYPIFTAQDSYDSVNKYFKDFFVKEQTELKQCPSNGSTSLMQLNPENNFDIIDVKCTENGKEDLWLKINYNGIEGFIPFSSLGENWTITENNLEYYKK